MVKLKWLVGLVVLFLGGCQTMTIPGESDHSLAWFVGCWQTGDGETIERWELAADTLLFGSNVLFSDEQVSFFEQMRIEIDGESATFFAHPMGRAPTPFVAVDQSSQSLVFENGESDFPQRIHYWRDGPRLNAEISLLDGTKKRRWVFQHCTMP
ncbi:MAG: DUF6265 family protein [Woeseiaceae bacterium]